MIYMMHQDNKVVDSCYTHKQVNKIFYVLCETLFIGTDVVYTARCQMLFYKNEF